MGIDTSRFRGGRKKEWADWLSDDPIEPVVRPRVHAPASHGEAKPEPVESPKKSSSTTPEPAKTVAIHITVPKVDTKKVLNKLQQWLPAVPKRLQGKPRLLIAGALCSVLLVGGIVYVLLPHDPKSPTGVLGEVSQTPQFKIVLPSGKLSDATSEKVAYNPQRKVASFTDTIAGIDVTVSQQKLPASFEDSPTDKVKKLAEGFSATDVIDTSTPTAYLGTSIKGPQTVIFTKNGLLIFIQSTSNIDKHDWAEYITKLQ